MNVTAQKIVSQILAPKERQNVIQDQDSYVILPVSDDLLQDAKNIARGLYSPLNGFLRKKDFESVISSMRLSSGEVWPIPIVLDLNAEQARKIIPGQDILLSDPFGTIAAIVKNIEVYQYDKKYFVKNVFGTEDPSHPGAARILESGEYLLGGEVWLLDDKEMAFGDLIMNPDQTRKIFQEKGWDKIVAFQTRNVPHRGHEFLQMEALKQADGLFIHPVVGRKKIGDFKDEIMVAAYEVLIDKYYPKDRVMLAVLPIRMRYAGPREAVMHALIRRNFGCTHFIVGRDHAGVGNFYPPFAAHEIFNQFSDEEIGIKILKFPEVVYCEECGEHRFTDQCEHKNRISFSATELRKVVESKGKPPFYLVRPEVYYLLLNNMSPLVDVMYQTEKDQKGFVLWFTGLSQAGKTTNADLVYQELKRRGLKVERLDGDVVRESLTADLGFSKADRDENIQRVGQIAKLFSNRGIIVVASFISPYRKERQDLRVQIPNFVEVFVNAPLEVCEARDTKGLYQKARRGEIKNFTGISDPYEAPENPELEIRTDQLSIEECVEKVVDHLKSNNHI